MNSREFRAFLDMLMCSDPWPVKDDGENQRTIIHLATVESKVRGHKDWIEAYHEYLTPIDPDSIVIRNVSGEIPSTEAMLKITDLVGKWGSRNEPIDLNSQAYLEKVKSIVRVLDNAI